MLEPQVTKKIFLQSIASDGPNAPEEVPARDVQAHGAKVAEKNYNIGFRYFTFDSVEVGGQTLAGKPAYDQGTYYFGEVKTIDEIKALPGVPAWMVENAVANLQQAGKNSAILGRSGRLIETYPGDVALSAFARGARAAIS